MRRVTSGRLTKGQKEVQLRREHDQESSFLFGFDVVDESNDVDPRLAKLLSDILTCISADPQNDLSDDYKDVRRVGEGLYRKDGLTHRVQRTRSGGKLYAVQLDDDFIRIRQRCDL
jgi:hypothetical protein